MSPVYAMVRHRAGSSHQWPVEARLRYLHQEPAAISKYHNDIVEVATMRPKSDGYHVGSTGALLEWQTCEIEVHAHKAPVVVAVRPKTSMNVNRGSEYVLN